MSESSEYFEIENLRDIKVKGRGAKRQIMVEIKWENYPETNNTWEPLENVTLAFAPELLADLKKAKDMKKKQSLIDEAIELIKVRRKEQAMDRDGELDHEKENPENEVNRSITPELNKDKESATHSPTKKSDRRKDNKSVDDRRSTNEGVILNRGVKRKIRTSSTDIMNNKTAIGSKPNYHIPQNKINKNQKSISSVTNNKQAATTSVGERVTTKIDRTPDPKDSSLFGYKHDAPLYTTKYTDVEITEGKLYTVKLTVDSNGNIMGKRVVEVENEFNSSENLGDLFSLIVSGMLNADQVIKGFQDNVRKHNEKCKAK